MKKLAQPTRSFFKLKISWKTSPSWLQLVFHFGTENRANQLKKPPCIDDCFIIGATFIFRWSCLEFKAPSFFSKCPFDRGAGEGQKLKGQNANWRGAIYKGAPLTQSPYLTGGHLRPSKSKRVFPIFSRAWASCLSFIFVTWWWNRSLHCEAVW